MTIAVKKLNTWKTLYKFGDYQKLADAYCTVNQKISQKFARDLVQEAFKYGVCRDNLYPVINSYYNKVEKQLKKIA